MPSYSRKQPMTTGGEVPRITGLNAFGEPFRGRKIRGVSAEVRAVGQAYSRAQSADRNPLAPRSYGNQAQWAEQKLAEAEEAGEKHRNRMAEEAAERGREKAKDASGTTTAPKRAGQLIASAGGGYKWASGDELDKMDEQKAAARRKARGTHDYMRRTRPETAFPVQNVA